MAFSAPEDVINAALVEVGGQRPIAWIYEGSPPARAALKIYGQTRDALLRARAWPFARRVLPLTLLKGPPPAGGYTIAQPWTKTYPPPGWLYEYAYPADCLLLGAVLPGPGMMFDLDPQPVPFRVDNDSANSPPSKVILTNAANAVAVYTGQITDPATWEPGFAEALIKALAAKLSKDLLQGQMAVAMEKQNIMEAGAVMTADSRLG